jgi:hypothetical protein
MEIDGENLKGIITDIFKLLREVDTELLAYRVVVRILTHEGKIDRYLDWDRLVDAAKQNPDIQKAMAAKYDQLLQPLMQRVDLADLQAKVLELLKQLPISGRPN